MKSLKLSEISRYQNLVTLRFSLTLMLKNWHNCKFNRVYSVSILITKVAFHEWVTQAMKHLNPITHGGGQFDPHFFSMSITA